ncbi:MAG: hypothetical protein WCD79_21090 [Chthoniobacteraceae bacterium]
MNTKFLLALFLGLLLIVPAPGQTPTPSEKISQDDVWVSISFSEKGAEQPPIEYYGTIKRTMLTAMLNTATPSGFLKLSHAAFMTDDGKIIPLTEARIREMKRGYSREMYFRIEAITRIVELDDQFVRDNSFDLMDKK